MMLVLQSHYIGLTMLTYLGALWARFGAKSFLFLRFRVVNTNQSTTITSVTWLTTSYWMILTKDTRPDIWGVFMSSRVLLQVFCENLPCECHVVNSRPKKCEKITPKMSAHHKQRTGVVTKRRFYLSVQTGHPLHRLLRDIALPPDSVSLCSLHFFLRHSALSPKKSLWV
jgi:hypothetical protein